MFYCSLVGLGVTGLPVGITDLHFLPHTVRYVRVAQASTTGHGTNVIQGLAVSMEATGLPIIARYRRPYLAVAFRFLRSVWGWACCDHHAGTCRYCRCSDDGPVTDNAGGIAEMAGTSARARHYRCARCRCNTTKAVTKGYAIGSAALAALVLFTAYVQDLEHYFPACALF